MTTFFMVYYTKDSDVMDLTKCKIQDFDDIVLATKESQGYDNCEAAIKYVLFDDDSVFPEDAKINSNKYLYISSSNGARKKAMMMQEDDLAHIMVKYCMQSFGLRCKDFNISEDELLLNQKRIDRLEISPYEMIEQVAYLAMNNVYLAYEYLFANKKILSSVVSYMMQERYISDIKDILDNFSGIVNNNDISTETRYSFYDAYMNLDNSFAEIKRNNPEYIK